MKSNTRFPTALDALVLIAPIVLAGDETSKWIAPDGDAGDTFGASVAMRDGLAIVGVFLDDTDKGEDAGSARLIDASTGFELAMLTAADGHPSDWFGRSVGVDGERAVAGAPHHQTLAGYRAGAAYLFDTKTGTQVADLVSDDGAASDYFGYASAIHGQHVIVGAIYDDDNGFNSGSAYVFDTTTGKQLVKLLADDGAAGDSFGNSVAIEGNVALVGAYAHGGAGAAYVFDATTGAQLAKLMPETGALGDTFGDAVAIEGNLALIGASGDDDLGFQSGSASLYDLTTGGKLLKLLPNDGDPLDAFGRYVALSGSTAVVGAFGDDAAGYDAGSAYVFDLTTGAQLKKWLASDAASQDWFGMGVALEGDTALVASPYDDDMGLDSGSVYLFDAGPAGTSYCTAGVSASGCQALLSTTGLPSESAASGFSLDALNVEGAKDGLFFFSSNGRQSAPWGNGSSYQCVVPPVKRAGLLLGTGTAAVCDGSFSQDFNSLWCPTCPEPQKNPGAGTVVLAQLWYRDPFNSSNQTTSLSDAVEFVVCP